MERPEGCSVQRIEVIQAGELVSHNLLYAAAHTDHAARAYRVAAARPDGGAETLELLHFEVTRRAGIAWRGREWWLDASSVDEALHRWMDGEGRMSRLRTQGEQKES